MFAIGLGAIFVGVIWLLMAAPHLDERPTDRTWR